MKNEKALLIVAIPESLHRDRLCMMPSKRSITLLIEENR
jgi:hypothetical protein